MEFHDQEKGSYLGRNTTVPFSMTFDGLIRDESLDQADSQSPQFECGDIIMEEDPFASVVDLEQAASVCHDCYKSADPKLLKRCCRCKFARFCDDNCSKKGWKTHKLECTLLAKYFERRGFYPDSLIRLVNLVMVKVSNGQAKMPAASCTPQTERDFTALLSHTEDIDDEIVTSDKFRHNITEISEYITPEASLSFGEKFLTETYSKVMTNCIAIQDRKGVQLGIGLYFGISQFDHSCVPNALYFARTLPPKISIMAIRNIRTITDVRISYINPMKPTQQRRAELKESHYFVCQCARCHAFEHDGMTRSLNCGRNACNGFLLLGKDDQPMGGCEVCQWRIENSDGILESAKKLMQVIPEMLNSVETLKAIQSPEFSREIHDVLAPMLKAAAKLLFRLNFYRSRLSEVAFPVLARMEYDRDELLIMMEDVIAAHRFYLGPVSLQLFHLLVTAARYAFQWENEAIGRTYAKDASWLARKLFSDTDEIHLEIENLCS